MPDQTRFFDDNGKDITEYMTVVPAVQYDATGRITGSVKQAWPYTQMRINNGDLFIKGDGQFNYQTNQSPLYVDLTGPTPVLKTREALTGSFDKTKTPANKEVVFKNLPACTVTFTGPASGSVKHPGGDFKIGFSMTGTYLLTFEPFPFLPMQVTITVTLL